MTIGDDSPNGDKWESECLWGSKHIVIEYEVDFDNCAITHPKEAVVGAQVLIQTPVYNPGNRSIPLLGVGELRGNMPHWQAENSIWRFSSDPINRMLSLRIAQRLGFDVTNGISGAVFGRLFISYETFPMWGMPGLRSLVVNWGDCLQSIL